MRVFITGATGFIGRAVVLRLRRDGHRIAAYVRSLERARSLLGADVDLVPAGPDDAALRGAIAESDAVVNLAGEPLIGHRWTPEYRERLIASRVGLTEDIVRAIAQAPARPKVLVSGSAVGFYGNRADESLTEESAPGDDFLADLCQRWEGAAERASTLGIRVVRVRTGVVLGREGGALAQMLPAFRAGVAGRLGSGAQIVPWIHLHDVAEIIARAVVDDRYAGALNATSPEPVTNRDFTGALAHAVHRSVFLPVPGLALRVAFGEASSALLGGQRALPAKLLALGHRFEFPSLGRALDDIVNRHDVRIEALEGDGRRLEPEDLARRRPRYLLRARATIDAPIDDVFAFFAEPLNLGLITPPHMELQVHGGPADMHEGATIDYRVRVGPSRIRWRTRVVRWQPGRCFIDVQEDGPYRVWWHEHNFRPEGRRTVMEDRVYYAPPVGWIGQLANRVFVAGELERIFGYRAEAIRLRFGAAGDGGAARPAVEQVTSGRA